VTIVLVIVTIYLMNSSSAGWPRTTPAPQCTLRETAPLKGTSIRSAGFRARFSAAVVAVKRGGKRVEGRIGDIVLEAGDNLVLDTGVYAHMCVRVCVCVCLSVRILCEWSEGLCVHACLCVRAHALNVELCFEHILRMNEWQHLHLCPQSASHSVTGTGFSQNSSEVTDNFEDMEYVDSSGEKEYLTAFVVPKVRVRVYVCMCACMRAFVRACRSLWR